MEKVTAGLTIADVAKLAGCSVATASRVLSGSKYPVSEEMRARILQAAAELGYSDNLKKRMLVNDQNPYFGIILPTVQNPTYLMFAKGIEQVASQAGFAAFILNSHRSIEMERKQINSLIQKKIGSLMLMSVDDSSDTLNHYLEMGGFACVFESNFPDREDVLKAKVNRFEAGRMATEYLLAQGHQSIAFVTTPLQHYQSRRLTLDGCRFAIEQHALPFSFANIFMAEEEYESATSLYEFEVGSNLAEKILNHPNRYTAVVCQNDLIAYGVMAGMKAAGAYVPGNISVIGIDNIPFHGISTPSLTTVDVAVGPLAQRAARLIVHMQRQEGDDPMRSPASIKPELIVRESVRRL